MQNLPDNVREVVAKLVPSSILEDIACFVLYDDHPAQRKNCDITICTKHGEVKEYFRREEVSSLLLRSNFKAAQIRIIRNNNCQLYYLVASDHEVVILSKINQLKVHQRVSNMESYDVDDYGYNGLASLKVVQKDDAVPLIFDDKFQRLSEQAIIMDGVHVDDSIPVLLDLKRKLVQTRYSIGCNVKSQNKLQDLRKLATFASYQKMHPSLEDSMFHQNYKQKCEAVKLQSKAPCVKICNQKFVIVLHAINKHKQVLRDVTVLLHAKNKPAMMYTTRLFTHKTITPFWEETKQTLENNVKTAIVVVVDSSELQFTVPSKIEFNGVISYRKLNKECLLPFDYVTIPYAETMESQMDILANELDENSILAIMASTERVDLTLRLLGDIIDDTTLPLPELFHIYLGMEILEKARNVVVHKRAAHHVLNGVMVVLERDARVIHLYHLAVYARSPGQIVSLINYIYDAIPIRTVVTSKLHIITSTAEALSRYMEVVPFTVQFNTSYAIYGVSILNQIKMILQYLDSCMVKMNFTKKNAMQNKNGNQIDLFANGVVDYMEFRTLLLQEAMNGIRALKRGQFSTREVEILFEIKE
ncbi:uncharacterized protein [Choristoneura fumiferana]|uniref:uncharacterized protein n=1 Tax=Choristoneura fumiferana TaxID=7141 RepID=UPI003D158B80